jgi:16S rRNA (uracil1498-N3)-methyltransferase
VHGQVVAVHPAGGEAAARITLYLALTGREKFEWMLQKCTEVGAAAFVPVISSRALVQDGRDAAKKLERWERIVREAAEQSRRGILPPVHPPLAFEAALQRAQPDALRLIAWEGEHSLTLRAALAPSKAAPAPTIAVFIGPEGGFSEAEIEAARAAGVQPVTLGERILRMETAAVVAAALVLYELYRPLLDIKLLCQSAVYRINKRRVFWLRHFPLGNNISLDIILCVSIRLLYRK